MGLEIAIKNESAPRKTVARAEKIKAEVTFRTGEQNGTGFLAPWKNERSNVIDIPVGETKFVIIAAVDLMKGRGLQAGFWRACTSSSTQDGRTILGMGQGFLTLPLEQVKTDNLRRDLEIRLLSETGEVLKTAIYDWKLAHTKTPIDQDIWFLAPHGAKD
jgi:hypothetical protein